jgi:hypothetical protein
MGEGLSNRWDSDHPGEVQGMSENDLIALPCTLSKGFFSSERVFEVQLANGESYMNFAPRHFCWNAAGKLLGENEALDQDEAGFVAARINYELSGDQLAVEVPDGTVLAVRKSQIRVRPTPIMPPRATSAL